MNVDKLLIKLLTENTSELGTLEKRDIKVLKSLAKIISMPNFITENQGRLLIKILRDNCNKFSSVQTEISTALEVPTWSKAFRVIDKTKVLFVSAEEPQLVIEFAFSSAIRKAVNGMSKKINGFFQQANGKQYRADLTEKNVVTLVDELQPLGFDIDEKITNFYKIIKSWDEADIRSQFLLTNITHANFQKHITADLGIDTPIDINVINDRSTRYQYFVEKTEKIPENLTEKIANRTSSKVWIDKKETSLDEVISSLLKLQRLPVLVVFDGNDHKKCAEELEILGESLRNNRIYDQVGIYFRLPNTEQGTLFNKSIADNSYNYNLDNTTRVVGVQNGKIPKFFLKSDWKPMSVIAIGSSLKQTKTAVYASSCDLIISYTDTQPIIETRVLWE